LALLQAPRHGALKNEKYNVTVGTCKPITFALNA
jgi:hypothetical protein